MSPARGVAQPAVRRAIPSGQVIQRVLDAKEEAELKSLQDEVKQVDALPGGARMKAQKDAKYGAAKLRITQLTLKRDQEAHQAAQKQAADRAAQHQQLLATMKAQAEEDALATRDAKTPAAVHAGPAAATLPPGREDWLAAIMREGGAIVAGEAYDTKSDTGAKDYSRRYLVESAGGVDTGYEIHVHWKFTGAKHRTLWVHLKKSTERYEKAKTGMLTAGVMRAYKVALFDTEEWERTN